MDRLVTVFGGGGFLGRYVAQALFATGARVRIVQRDPRRAFFLRPLAGLGQWQFAAADIRDPERVMRATQGSDAVINLVGVLKGDFTGVHVEGARNVAMAAAAAGASALVHVSAIGADPESPSRYGESKGKGEAAVLEAFPNATIVRPSLLFGREDNFVNRFAGLMRMLPVIPVIRGSVKLRPLYAADAGKAVAEAALDPADHRGRLYELGGPQTMTMRELMEWINAATGHERMLADIPDGVARMMARTVGWLPGAPITWDQWLMLQNDIVPAQGSEGLAEFGIAPTPLAAVSEGWLTSYRRRGRFAAKSPY